MNIEERFEQMNDEFLKFERIEKPRSKRPDLHAFLLLDELVPGEFDMVSASEHDEIYLDVEPQELERATDEQILELVRCGVRCSSDGLCMFT